MSDPLPPLPEGWTLERISATDYRDRAKMLSKKELQMIDAYFDEYDRRYPPEENPVEESDSSDEDVLGPPPPLPQGWTAERYDETDWMDFDKVEELLKPLPQKEAYMLIRYNRWRLKKETLEAPDDRTSTERVLAAAMDEARASTGVQTTEESTSPGDLPVGHDSWQAIANKFQEHGLTCFGYTVYKTWGYTGESCALWARFWSAWQSYFAELLSEAVLQRPHLVDKLDQKLKWYLVEDPQLDNASNEMVRKHFESLPEENSLDQGLEIELTLVPREDTARQFLDQPGAIGLMSVMAVDVYGGSSQDKEYLQAAERDLRERHGIVNMPSVTLDFYPGYFWIRLDALLPEAWLFAQGNDIADMYRGAAGTWVGPGKTDRPGVTGLLTTQDDVGGDITYRFD